MKSYVTFVQGLYDDILSDIAIQYPILRQGLCLDKARLRSLIEVRGLSFATIDLPELGKHFERSLDEGTFRHCGIAGSRPYRKGSTIPRLFKEMYLRVFDEFGVLRTDVDVDFIRLLRQLFYAAKKIRMECHDKRTWRAIAEFFDIDLRVRRGTRNWELDELEEIEPDRVHLGQDLVHPSSSIQPDLFDPVEKEGVSEWGLLDSIQNVCDIVSSTLGRFDPALWRTKHGPGAVADLRGGVSKYSFPYWPAKLDRVFPLSVFAFANYGLWAEHVGSENGSRGFSPLEPPSRLLAVPKSQKGPRLIAAEPTGHLWCQQSIKDYFTNRIAYTPIGGSVHFRDQSFNQRAAIQASQCRGWTIDLSSASDRLSPWVVERVFRRNESLLQALHSSRTRWIFNSIDRESPRYHLLRKFSTAGSAVTFPVQTIVFTCIAIGTLLYRRGLTASIRTIRASAPEVQVFGDDIIVPEDVGVLLQEVLGHLGFKVNPHKTFGTGKFRESCGLDVYDGYDVTPVYSMTYPEWSRPESIISYVATRNNFYRSHYRLRAARMETIASERLRLKLPQVAMGSGNIGWVTDGPIRNTHLRTRWDPHRHCTVARAHSLTGVSKRGPDLYGARLLQYFTEAPEPTTKWESGVPLRPQLSLKLGWEVLEAGTAMSGSQN